MTEVRHIGISPRYSQSEEEIIRKGVEGRLTQGQIEEKLARAGYIRPNIQRKLARIKEKLRVEGLLSEDSGSLFTDEEVVFMKSKIELNFSTSAIAWLLINEKNCTQSRDKIMGKVNRLRASARAAAAAKQQIPKREIRPSTVYSARKTRDEISDEAIAGIITGMTSGKSR